MTLFDFVKSHLPILDVVSEFLNLKQMGGYWKGPCPFHSENDASFTVSPDKQIFYCFGCQASGDVIGFIAKIENFTQLEAVRYVIDRYKLVIPDDLKVSHSKDLHERNLNERYFETCQVAARWMYKQQEQAVPARNYLESRGMSHSTIQYFEIGYFPGGVQGVKRLIRDAARDNILVTDLLQAGIVLEGRSGLYSPFEERIVFPIKDSLGRYCGFGGRVFRHGDDRAKYYNSKENDGFSKGKLLFGLDKAKRAMQKKDCAFLVEGNFDCVAMVQHGYENTVATLGTACTLDHLKILSRHISVLYLLYDGDQAGKKAVLRIAQSCWSAHIELKVIRLPDQDDPDTFLKKKGDLETLIKESKDIFSFFIDIAGEDFFSLPLPKKLAQADKILELLVVVEDPLTLSLLLQQASSVMKLPIDLLERKIKDKRGSFKHKKIEVAQESDAALRPTLQTSKRIQLEMKILTAVLNSLDKPGVFDVQSDLLPYFSVKIRALLEKVHELSSLHDNHIFKHLIDSIEGPAREWVVSLSMKENVTMSQSSFDGLLVQFCKSNWRTIVQDIKQKIQEAKQRNDNNQLKKLLKRFSMLKQGMQERGLV